MAPASVLSAKKRSFVAALSRGDTLDAAAVTVGVSPRTSRRYAGDPLVRVALREVHDQALGVLAQQLAAGAGDMLAVLRDVARDRKTPPGVRVMAAGRWLDHTLRMAEMVQLAARVAMLEDAVLKAAPSRF